MNYKDKPITKRLVACALGVATIFWVMWTHRGWEWAYFASIMQMSGATAKDISEVAIQSGKNITTVTVAAMVFIGAVVVFFITGNVSVLKAALGVGKLSAVAGVTGEALSEHITQVSDNTQRIIQQAAERYKDDPSYAPIKPDTEEPFR